MRSRPLIPTIGRQLEPTHARAADYDAQCTWDPLLSPSGCAGVTTVIMGNCGVGCAPTRKTEADREFMIGMLGAIEDIPAEVLRQGTKWEVEGK